MKTTIRVTRKGQTTLPAEIRRKLGIAKTGGVLAIDYLQENNRVILSRPMTIEELSARASSYIRPGTKPLKDVRSFIEKNRRVDHEGYIDD